MRLRRQKSLIHPSAGTNLVDMLHINEGNNMLLRDLGLTGSIIDVVTCKGGCVTSINITFITNDGKTYIVRLEDPPMTLE